MIETNALRIFRRVAKEKSISRAAEKLHYVQSNVTARVKHLENEVGAQLFYRKKRGMVLTPAGKILLDYSDQIFYLLEQAQKAVQDSLGLGGKLIIGSLETTAAVRLPSILTDYHKRFSEVDLILKTGTTQYLIQEVLNYNIDGAFVAGAVQHPDLVQEPAFLEELVLVTKTEITSIKDLREAVLLVFRSGCTYRTSLEQWIRETGMLSSRILEFGTLDAILGCVTAGMGVTLLPKSVVDRSHFHVELSTHEIAKKLSKVTTYFIRRKDTIVTKAMNTFLEAVKTN